MTMDGYDLNSESRIALPESLEFRLVVRLMPMRCYLDGIQTRELFFIVIIFTRSIYRVCAFFRASDI